MNRPDIEGCIMCAAGDDDFRAADLREVARYALSLEAALKEAKGALNVMRQDLIDRAEMVGPDEPVACGSGAWNRLHDALASIAKLKE